MNFEKLAPGEKACPICRRKDYKWKKSEIGRDIAMKQAVILLQKHVRRWICERRFVRILKENLNGIQSKMLRRRVLFSNLSKCSSMLSKIVKKEELNIDKFL